MDKRKGSLVSIGKRENKALPECSREKRKWKNRRSSKAIIISDVLQTILLFISGVVVKETTHIGVHDSVSWIVSILILSTAYVRLFLLGHELFHMVNARLPKKTYSVVKLIIGSMTMSPIISLKLSHQIHHSFNCNWSIYKGPMLIIEKSDFLVMDGKERIAYWLTRRIELIWLTGLVAHVLIPRLRLIKEFCELLVNKTTKMRGLLWQSQIKNGLVLSVGRMELVDTIIASIGSFALICLLSRINGALVFLYLLSVIVGQSVIMIIFHIQHTFPGAYAAGLEKWNKEKFADGTANINLGKIGNWITVNFAVHHVRHHLNETVSWHDLNKVEMGQVNLRNIDFDLKTIYQCFSLLIWCKQRQTFVKLEEI